MLKAKAVAHWEEGYYYNSKVDDIYVVPVCSRCGYSYKGDRHEQYYVWKMKECPGCQAEMSEEVNENEAD